MLSLNVSWGEALDKWNILHIKQDNIQNVSKLQCIRDEINALEPQIIPLLKSSSRLQQLYSYLDFFNRKLWKLCDQVRVTDVNVMNSCTSEYAQQCLDIIKFNDARFRVKQKINACGSVIHETKNFGGSCVCIEIPPTLQDYKNLRPIVFYLSVCYDEVVVPTPQLALNDQLELVNYYERELNVFWTAHLNDTKATRRLHQTSTSLPFYQDICHQLGMDYDQLCQVFGCC